VHSVFFVSAVICANLRPIKFKSWNGYSVLGMISPVFGLGYPPSTLGQTTPVLGSITSPKVPGKNSPVRGLTTPFSLVNVEGPGGAAGAGCGVGPGCMGE